VGAENRSTSRDVDLFVDQLAESIEPGWPAEGRGTAPSGDA